jgi:hypothetical protein
MIVQSDLRRLARSLHRFSWHVLRAERIHDYQYLVFPRFVAKGCAIEFLAVVLPERHEIIHIGNELIVVVALEEVNHFVDNDVL